MRLPYESWTTFFTKVGYRKKKGKKAKRIKPRSHHFESLEPRQMLAVDLLNFQLVEFTGTPGDYVTTDPTVEAEVSGDFSGGQVDIEFDNYADGIVEDTMTVYTPGTQITYDPSSLDSSVNSHEGLFTLSYRTIEYDSSYNVVATSDWQDFEFTLEQLPDVDIQVYDQWFTTIDDGVGSVDFGSTSLGAAVSRTFDITNYGSDDLTLDSESLVLPTGFQLVSGFDATVAQYATTQFTIELFAESADFYAGTLEFATDDPDSAEFSFTVSGQVTSDTPEIYVQDESSNEIASGTGPFDFGTTTLNTSVTKTFTIYNNGSGTLQLDRTSLSLPSGFEVVTEFAETVATYSSTTLAIRMLADQGGAKSGLFSFSTNDADENPFNFTIQGFVDDGSSQLPPEIEVLEDGYYSVDDGAGSVDFGQTIVGIPVTKTFTVNNTGEADLTLASLVVPAGYSVTSNFNATVVGGGSTSFTVRLDATIADDYDGAITFTTNDTDEATFDFAVSAVVDPDPSQILVTVSLTNNTGSSPSDDRTSDPKLSGSVSGDFEGGSVRVEFDHNNSGSAEGFVDVANSGDSFSYDPVSNDATLDGFLGLVPMRHRYIKYDSVGAVVETGQWQDFTFTLAQDPDTGPIRAVDFGLFNDTDTAGDLKTTDPTLTAAIEGDFAGGYVHIEFDHGTEGVAESHEVASEPGDKVLYDPRIFDSNLFGFAGQVSIQYRLIHFDANDVVLSTGDWTAFDFEMVAPPSGNSLTVAVGLAEQTGESNGTPTANDSKLTGSVTGNFSQVVIEFDHDGDDAIDGTISTELDGQFTYEPGSLPYGQQTVRARALEWDTDYGTFRPGDWTDFTFILETAAAPDVLELDLAYDTPDLSSEGEDASYEDGVTRDPTLTGKLDPDSGAVNSVKIELDLDNDGTADQTTRTNSAGSFSYRPAGLAAGAVTVQARGAVWDATLEADVYGEWKPFTFTYEVPAVPQVDTLSLLNDTGEITDDDHTFDPTVQGTLSGHDRLISYVDIEFDYDGNDEVDATTTSDYDGEFIFTPAGLAIGAVSLRARTSTWDNEQNQYVAGNWLTLGFTLEAAPNDPIAVEELKLFRDTLLPTSERTDENDGSEDNVTKDPTITGHLTNDSAVAYQNVEIDYDGDGVAEATTTSQYDGSFFHTPTGLTTGENTLSVRAREWDYALSDFSFGAWTSLTFTLEGFVNQTPTIDTLKLRSDSGISQTDNVTANPMLTGTVIDDGSLYGITVEFDHDGNGVADGVAFTNNKGEFNYVPGPLLYGAPTVSARAAQWDAGGGQFLFGDWTDFTFTYEYQPNAAAVLSDVRLANDTGDENDGTSTDATIQGQVINEGSLEGIEIEVDFNNDGVFDDWTETNRLGEFEFNADTVAYGAASIQLRTRELDLVGGQLLYGNWEPFSFTFEEEINLAASIDSLNLKVFTGGDPDPLVTTDPELEGTVSNDGELENLLIEFDHTGNGTIDGWAFADEQGNFSHRPTGLEAGEVTINARVKEYDQYSAPVYSVWTPITFTLEVEPDTSLRIDTLALEDDTGNSNTDGATSEAGITGQLVGGVSVDGVTIEIDTDGNGFYDTEVTSDDNGFFSYEPETIVEGVNKISARPISKTDGWYDFGEWKSVAFVYSTDPDSTESQALAAGLEASNSGWQQAEDTLNSTIKTARASYNSARQGELSNYETQKAARLQQQITSRKASVATAVAELTSAKSGLIAGESTTLAVYANSAASFGGDPTGFTLTSFQSPQDLLPDASTETQTQNLPQPPVDAHDYVGQDFNYQKDKTYQTNLTQANKDYSDSVKAADTALDAVYTNAADAIAQAKATAEQQHEQNVAAAKQTYQADLLLADSNINLLQVTATHRENVQKAGRAYELELEKNEQKLQQAVESLLAQYDLDAQYDDDYYAGGGYGAESLSFNYGEPLISDPTFDEYNYGFGYFVDLHALDQVETEQFNLFVTAFEAQWQFPDHGPKIEDPLGQYTDAEQEAAASALGAAVSQYLYIARLNVADAYVDFGTALADLLKQRDNDDAASLLKKQTTINASQKVLDDAVADRNFEVAKDRVLAKYDFEKRVAEHATTRDQAITTEIHAQETAIAQQHWWHTVDLAAAETKYWKDVALAKQDAFANWATKEGTAWATLQKELAANEKDFYDQLATKYETQQLAEANAYKTMDETLADEKQTRDNGLAAARELRAVDKAKATLELYSGSAGTDGEYNTADDGEGTLAADRDRAKQNAASWQALQDDSAQAEKTFRDDIALAEYNRGANRALADWNAREQLADYEKNLMEQLNADELVSNHETLPGIASQSTVPFLDYFHDSNVLYLNSQQANIDSIVSELEAAQHGHAQTRHNDVILAHELKEEARHVAIKDYQVEYHKDEKAWGETIADAQESQELAVAEADVAFNITVVGLSGDYEVDRETANVAFWNTLAPADEVYLNAKADQQRIWNNEDAKETAAFQIAQAASYKSAIDSWNTQLNTPWTNYHAAVAAAEYDRIEALADVDENGGVIHVMAAGQADVDWTEDYTEANKINTLARANAYKTEMVTVVAALNTYATNVGAHRATGDESFTKQVAAAKTDHDKKVLEVNETYRNALVIENIAAAGQPELSLQNALDDADWVYYRKIVEQGYELAIGDIDQAEFNTQEANAAKLRDDTKVDARKQRSLNISTARQTWVNARTEEMVTLATKEKDATQNLAEDIRKETVGDPNAQPATIGLAGKQQAAAILLVAGDDQDPVNQPGLAGAAYAQAIAHNGADVQYAADAESASAAYSTKSNAADSAFREAFDLALNDYFIALETSNAGNLQTAVANLQANGAGAVTLGWTTGQADLADADKLQVEALKTPGITYQQQLTTVNTSYNNRLNTALNREVTDQNAADLEFMNKLAGASKTQTIAYVTAQTGLQFELRRATVVKSEVDTGIEADYLVDRAKALEKYVDAQAAANHTWVTTLAPKKADLVKQANGVTDATYADDKDQADDTRKATIDQAKLTFVTKIGDKQITRAEKLGDQLITQAGSIGDAKIVYTGALTTANSAYAASDTTETTKLRDAINQVSASLTADLSNADTLRTPESRPGEDAWRAAQKAADQDLSERRAQAESSFQIGAASQKLTAHEVMDSEAGPNTPANHAEKTAQAAGELEKVTATAAAKAAAARDRAGAEADYQDGLADQLSAVAEQRELEDAGFLQEIGTLGATRSHDLTAARLSYSAGNVTRGGMRVAAFSLADKTQLVAYATAEKEYAKALAAAEKEHQVAKLDESTSGTADSEKTRDLANAKLDREIAHAAADRGWIAGRADANKTYANDQTDAAKSLGDSLAGIEKSYETGEAAKVKAHDAALALLDNAFNTGFTAIDNALNAAFAEIGADLNAADVAGDAAAAVEADTRLVSDGSQYAKDHTATNVSWWSSLTPDFLQLTTDWNAELAAATTAINSLSTTLATNIGTAVETFATSTATAEETLEKALAAAERDFVQALTVPTESYTDAVALAEYNYDIALAAAQQNLDLGERLFEVSVLGGGLPTDPGAEFIVTRLAEGVTPDPYTQSEFDTDKAHAESAKEQALEAAGEVYATSHAAAAGARQQAIAAANSAYAASQTTVDQTLVDAQGSETETYEHAVADREKLRVETSAAAQAAYDKQAASTRATKLSDLAATTPTHFATLFSGMASLGSNFVDSAADTIADLKTDFAEHDRVYAHGQATDDKTTASSLTAAANTFTNTVTSAFGTAADSTATLLNNLAALGAHLPFLPSVATAPTVVMPEISQVATDHFDDYNAPTSSAASTRPFDDLLAEHNDWTDLVDGVGNSVSTYTQHDTETATRFTDDRLDNGLVRDDVKSSQQLSNGFTPDELDTLNDVKTGLVETATTVTQSLFDVANTAIGLITTSFVDPFKHNEDIGERLQFLNDDDAPQGAFNSAGDSGIAGLTRAEAVRLVSFLSGREVTFAEASRRLGDLLIDQPLSQAEREASVQILIVTDRQGVPIQLVATDPTNGITFVQPIPLSEEILPEGLSLKDVELYRSITAPPWKPNLGLAKQIAGPFGATRTGGPFGAVFELTPEYFRGRIGGMPTIVCHGRCATGRVGPLNSHMIPGVGSLHQYAVYRDTAVIGASTAGVATLTAVAGPVLVQGGGAIIIGAGRTAVTHLAYAGVAAPLIASQAPGGIEAVSVAVDKLIYKYDELPSETKNRVDGAVMIVGGSFEAVAGMKTASVGGVILFVHGYDNVRTGWYKLTTGEAERTVTSKTISAIAESYGFEPGTAEFIGETSNLVFDVGISPRIIAQANELKTLVASTRLRPAISWPKMQGGNLHWGRVEFNPHIINGGTPLGGFRVTEDIPMRLASTKTLRFDRLPNLLKQHGVVTLRGKSLILHGSSSRNVRQMGGKFMAPEGKKFFGAIDFPTATYFGRRNVAKAGGGDLVGSAIVIDKKLFDTLKQNGHIQTIPVPDMPHLQQMIFDVNAVDVLRESGIWIDLDARFFLE